MTNLTSLRCIGPCLLLATMILPTSAFAQQAGMGVQFNNWVAAQIEGSVGYLFFVAFYLRGALTVNFTPVRWFTISLGPVLGTFSGFETMTYAGLTLRPDFHVYQYRSPSGRRHSFTIGIGTDLGGAVVGSDGSAVLGAMVNLGYTMH
jgi:hypothetical protein